MYNTLNLWEKEDDYAETKIGECLEISIIIW